MNQQLNKVHLIDCMDFMRQIPEGYFDLSIVDPPYFRGPESGDYYNSSSKKRKKNKTYRSIKIWNPPKQDYFDELLRISKQQIIWGINYYDIKNLGSGRIIWDKKNDNGGNNYSHCEIAYCSSIKTVKIFRYLWNGMLQQNMKNKENKIHLNQKPVALYKWLLQNYAEPSWKIFDSHVGSRSLGIACYDMGFYFEGTELDEDYFNDQEERFKNHIANQELFSKTEIQQAIYENKLLL